MTPEETVNESALGWLWEETYIAAAEVEAESSLYSSTASGDFLHPGSATSYPGGSHHGQAGLRNSVIVAFTGRNDARNKGDEASVFGDGTAMDGLTVRSMHGGETCRVQWQNVDVLIDNTLVMDSRDLVPQVRMPRCAGRHFALQWDVTRAPHLRQSVLCSSRVAVRHHWLRNDGPGAHPQHCIDC